MAAPRSYNNVIQGGGACIQWDWKQRKYVFIDKQKLNKDLDTLAQVDGTPYDARKQRGVVVRRPSYKIQGKKACNPSQFSNSRGKNLAQVKAKADLNSSQRNPLPGAKKHLPVWAPKGKERLRAADPSGDRHSDVLHRHNKHEHQRISRQSNSIPNPPPELMTGNATFVSIISSRLIHLRAAHTFWRQSPNSLLSYLIKTEDDAVTVDVLPVVIRHLNDQTTLGLQISMGACLDLLPTIRRLLDSKFEDYVKVGLDMLRTLLRRWWDDVKTVEARNPSQDMLHSRSTPGLYTSFVAMTDQVHHLSKRRGETGKKAQVVSDILEKL